MSTFQGLIAEFPGISVDQFGEHNLSSTIYFLSHVHTDHMKGLSECTFHEHLAEEKIVLYSHEVSTTYLRGKYSHLKECFQFLPVNQPITLKTKAGFEFTVTLMPAGHCPGSVMFLFESDQHKILYTGDYRLNLAEFKKFKALYTMQGTLKQINKIHLDTTFMFKRYEQFPSRQESLDTICTLIGEWLDMNPINSVNLITPYYYGAEYLLTQIYERFNLQVHVLEESYNIFYKYFPNMDKCITLAQSARIHSNCNGCRSCCLTRPTHTVRTIKVTSMIWKDWHVLEKYSENCGFNTYRVCYSTHASLQEIKDILQFLKPHQVDLNVEPENLCDRNEILELIDECLGRISPFKQSPTKKLDIKSLSQGYTNEKHFQSPVRSQSQGNEKESKRRGELSDDDNDDEYLKLKSVKARKFDQQLAKYEGSVDLDLSLLD